MGVFHFFLLIFISFISLLSLNIQWGNSEVLYVQAYNMTEVPKEQYIPAFTVQKDLQIASIDTIEVQNEEFVEVLEEKQIENKVLTSESLEEIQRIKKILYNDRDYLKKNGSRSFRNNNPGNLRYTGQEGSIGKDGNGFAIFPSYELGQKAHIRQINLDAQRGYTIADFVSKFAPKEENFSDDYTAFLLRRFPEFHPDTALNNVNTTELQAYMQRMEGWIETENHNIVEEVPLLTAYEKKAILQKRKCKELQDIKDRMSCMRLL